MISDDRESLESRIEELQAMLALILSTVGEPIVVTKEALLNGLPKNAIIAIDDDLERDAFVFRIQHNEQ